MRIYFASEFHMLIVVYIRIIMIPTLKTSATFLHIPCLIAQRTNDSLVKIQSKKRTNTKNYKYQRQQTPEKHTHTQWSR